MEPGSSLPHLQRSVTCLYPEPHRSSQCPLPTYRKSILILSSHLCLGLSSVSFSLTNQTLYTSARLVCMDISSVSYTRLQHCVSLSMWKTFLYYFYGYICFYFIYLFSIPLCVLVFFLCCICVPTLTF